MLNVAEIWGSKIMQNTFSDLTIFKNLTNAYIRLVEYFPLQLYEPIPCPTRHSLPKLK